MDYPVALLVFGILLLLVGLVGKVRAKELEVGTSSPSARVIIGVVGVGLISLSLFFAEQSAAGQSAALDSVLALAEEQAQAATVAQAQAAEARAAAAEEALADTQARAAADAQAAADARVRTAEEALAAAEAQAAADAQAAREAALAAEQALAAVDEPTTVRETEPAFVEVEVIVHTGSGRGGGVMTPSSLRFRKTALQT